MNLIIKAGCYCCQLHYIHIEYYYIDLYCTASYVFNDNERLYKFRIDYSANYNCMFYCVSIVCPGDVLFKNCIVCVFIYESL